MTCGCCPRAPEPQNPPAHSVMGLKQYPLLRALWILLTISRPHLCLFLFILGVEESELRDELLNSPNNPFCLSRLG